MPYATTDDGVKLYYEETGTGTPIVFVHEFAADHRSWEMQMRHFGQRYRSITYSARGYPPSDIPEKPASYSQNRATDDILAVMDHLKIQKAHVVGLSMGGFASLHFGFRHPTRALSLVVAGCGYGAEKDQVAKFKSEVQVVAKSLLSEGMPAFAEKYAYGPTRVQFENKDPRGFAQFKKELAEHSALGSANTQIGCQGERPSLYDLVDQMRALTVPTLVLTGDEDWPCLAPSMLMKRENPVGGAVGDAQLRPHGEPRGPRPVQQDRRRLHRPGRYRPLAQARPARHGQLDHRDEILTAMVPED